MTPQELMDRRATFRMSEVTWQKAALRIPVDKHSYAEEIRAQISRKIRILLDDIEFEKAEAASSELKNLLLSTARTLDIAGRDALEVVKNPSIYPIIDKSKSTQGSTPIDGLATIMSEIRSIASLSARFRATAERLHRMKPAANAEPYRAFVADIASILRSHGFGEKVKTGRDGGFCGFIFELLNGEGVKISTSTINNHLQDYLNPERSKKAGSTKIPVEKKM